jgi:hypothetical protein
LQQDDSDDLDEELVESDSDEEYEVEHIPTISTNTTNTRTNNTPTIAKSSNSHFAQKKCCCGIPHPEFNAESTKHKCTVSGLKVMAVFCLNLDEYDGEETTSTSAPCKKCLPPKEKE